MRNRMMVPCLLRTLTVCFAFSLLLQPFIRTLPQAGTVAVPTRAAECPGGWHCTNVGKTMGDETVEGAGGWTVTSPGTLDGGATSDSFRYLWHSLDIKGSISARVIQDGTKEYAEAGIMFRDGLGVSATYYAALMTPGHGLIVLYRPDPGAQVAVAGNFGGSVPLHVKVERNGNIFGTYTSADGRDWHLVKGSEVNVAMGRHVAGGVAVALRAPGVAIVDVNGSSATPSPSLPSSPPHEPANCQTPDIITYPQEIEIPLELQSQVGSQPGSSENRPITRLPYRYTGEVAEFCAADLGIVNGLTADVTWETSFDSNQAAYSYDEPIYSGSPYNASQSDPNARITRLPSGRYAVMSTFVVNSLGHIDIGVIVRQKEKRVPGHSGRWYGREVAGVTSRIYTDDDWSKPAHVRRIQSRIQAGAGAALVDYGNYGEPDSSWATHNPLYTLSSHANDPWFSLGFYNEWVHAPSFKHLYGKLLTDLYSANDLSGGLILTEGRSLVSALAAARPLNQSGPHLDPKFCKSLVTALVDTKPADKVYQQPRQVITTMIASNASAADALIDCADNVPDEQFLGPYATRQGGKFGQATGQERYLWRIARAYVADHLDEYAQPSNYQSPAEQKRAHTLHIAALLAVGTSDGYTGGNELDLRELGGALAMWTDTHLPHPLLTCVVPCTTNDAANVNFWSGGIGNILDTVRNSIQSHVDLYSGNAAAVGAAEATATYSIDTSWGLVSVGIAVGVVTVFALPEGAVGGAVGLAINSVYNIGANDLLTQFPDVPARTYDPRTYQDTLGKGMATLMALLLIQTHGLYDPQPEGIQHPKSPGPIVPNEGDTLPVQLARVVSDGFGEHAYNCTGSQIYLTNQRLQDTHLSVCQNLFVNMHLTVQ